MVKIPLTNSPNQTFYCVVPVNNKNINLRFNLWYNIQAGYWLLTLSDYKTGKEYFSNLPLLFSYGKHFNILSQLGYKNIGMCFMLPKEEDVKSAPDDKNLGKAYVMIWGDNIE